MRTMKKVVIRAIIMSICHANIINSASGTMALESQDRTKRSFRLSSQSIENVSNLNRADNDETTSSSTLGSFIDALNLNDNVLTNVYDGKPYLFRPANDVTPESAFDNQIYSIAGTQPFESYILSDPRKKKFFSVFPLRSSPKRAPSGFLGLRGKKYQNEKKSVPSGFMGMRGKKSDYINEPVDIELHELLQKESNFFNAIRDILSVDKAISNEIEKRAPHGFLGLRGKKFVNSADLLWEEKRAPSGFVGLRGKRQIASDFTEEYMKSSHSLPSGSYGEKDFTSSSAIKKL